MEWSQQASVFNNEDNLKDYSVIVFLHANGSSLNDGQMKNLKQLVRQGGGFVGIHATSVTQELDEWYDFDEALTDSMHVLLSVDESTECLRTLPDNFKS